MDKSSKEVTITEVAQTAGVSIATVSLILNGKSDSLRISEKTKTRVRNIAENLGYRANPFASALRKGKTGVIGVISRSVATPFLGSVARALQRAAEQAGAELLIASARQSFDTMKGQLSIMQNHLFDGVILLGDIPNLEQVVANLRASGKPFVSVETGTTAPPPVVNIDEEKGMNLALDHLRGLGHTRIAYLGDSIRTSTGERREAYERYLLSHGLYFTNEYLQLHPHIDTKLGEITQILLGLPERPTAIFCAADGHALLLQKELHRTGTRVPYDLSVMGFDDTREAMLAQPELTTVRQPPHLLAEAAIHLLFSLIDDPREASLTERIELIEPELVVRASTAPPLLS